MAGRTQIKNLPEGRPGLSRRELLTRAAAGAVTAGLAGPVSLATPAVLNDDSRWKKVKSQFVLDPNLTMVNAANLCPCPAGVLETYLFLTRDVDRNPSSQNRAKFSNLRKASRSALASYLGAKAEEIALVRNTSEANNTVVAGLEMGSEDEVVVWDQNHPTNNLAWDIRAKRYGFHVRRITIPAGDISQDELAGLFAKALSDRTRLLALTHVSNLSGVQLPIEEICKVARRRRVLTLVDGAQTFGSLDLDVQDLDCDFFTGSAHKWFMGPREAGILYIRKELVEKIWPLSVGIGYERALDTGSAAKFEVLGQRDDAALAALAKTVDFHREIGEKKVEKRVRELATTLYEGLSEIEGVHIHTPADPESRAGVVVFKIRGLDTRQVLEALYKRHRVGCAAMPEPFDGIRFSPHVYNTMDEMERLIGIVGRLSSSQA